MKELRGRSIAKAITWRLLASVTTAVIVYVFTRKPILSALVGVTEASWKLALYYLHERAWARIAWGLAGHPLVDLPVTKPLTAEDKQLIRQRLQELGYL